MMKTELYKFMKDLTTTNLTDTSPIGTEIALILALIFISSFLVYILYMKSIKSRNMQLKLPPHIPPKCPHTNVRPRIEHNIFIPNYFILECKICNEVLARYPVPKPRL